MADPDKQLYKLILEDQKNRYWPSTATMSGAVRASEFGVVGALGIALIVGCSAAWISYSEKAFTGNALWWWLHAAAFAALALGMRLRSRSAAYVALPFFLLSQALVSDLGATPTSLIVLILMLFLFINGIRGTRAVHRLRAQQAGKA